MKCHGIRVAGIKYECLACLSHPFPLGHSATLRYLSTPWSLPCHAFLSYDWSSGYLPKRKSQVGTETWLTAYLREVNTQTRIPGKDPTLGSGQARFRSSSTRIIQDNFPLYEYGESMPRTLRVALRAIYAWGVNVAWICAEDFSNFAFRVFASPVCHFEDSLSAWPADLVRSSTGYLSLHFQFRVCGHITKLFWF